MAYIVIGILGFVFFWLYDLISFKSKSNLKYIFNLFGALLICISSLLITANYSQFILPLWALIPCGITCTLLFLLLIYSVFIEVRKKSPDSQIKLKLVTTGTYALTRHPGVLWFFLLYVCGCILFQNFVLLYAGLLWTIVNIFYVFLQERFIFHKIFDGYDQYIKSTPMIIPNYRSLEKCLTTLKWRNT